MREMTQSNLEAAFAGESQAHMKYKAFAEKAEKEGFANVARLFQAIAYAEEIHATKHLKTLGKVGSTAENLQAGIDGENYEVEEMYPAFLSVAEAQDEKRASITMEWAMEAEKTHSVIYDEARKAVLEGNDADFGDIHICETCGWTVSGEPPDQCPICKAKKFKKF
jgi:rubrerythrin